MHPPQPKTKAMTSQIFFFFLTSRVFCDIFLIFHFLENRRSNYWVVRFSEQERWGHNLMGWTSTRDPNHGLRLEFPTKDAAIQFAEAEGFISFLFFISIEKFQF